MNQELQHAIARILRELGDAMESLTDSQVQSLLAGESRVDLSVTPKATRRAKAESPPTDSAWCSDVIARLTTARTREEGFATLDETCSTKEKLIQLGRTLDLPLQKKDSAEKIREAIVEATIPDYS